MNFVLNDNFWTLKPDNFSFFFKTSLGITFLSHPPRALLGYIAFENWYVTHPLATFILILWLPLSKLDNNLTIHKWFEVIIISTFLINIEITVLSVQDTITYSSTNQTWTVLKVVFPVFSDHFNQYCLFLFIIWQSHSQKRVTFGVTRYIQTKMEN